MELRVLGPLELIGPEGPVALGAAKVRRLLAALAVSRGVARSADALIDAIWEGKPPPSQQKLLQVYVSQLRKLLPPPAQVVTIDGGYILELPPDDLDSARFEQLVREGRTARVAGNPTLAVALLQRALRLWRGEAYAGFAAEEFARDEARRLEELRVGCLEERIQAELDLGHGPEMLAELTALASAQPLGERLHGQLMVALYRCGRQADALAVYSELRRRLDLELGLEPGAELRDLQRRILRHDAALGAPISERPPSRLVGVPFPATSLVGRSAELDELHALLERSEVRMVTLTGAAGSGKTRLALAYALAHGSTYANGCVFVELAAVRDPQLVLPTIAHVLGVEDVDPGLLPEVLASWLAERELLLIVDNVEHLAETAPALAALITAGPRPTLLLTSRRVLHVSGEHVFAVTPLPERDAVELFAQRARAVQSAFMLTSENEESVREICRRLDGLPLAIELAAARVDTLTPAAMCERLTTRLSLLTGGPRDLPARQQTIREALDWSTTLLDEEEKAVLARLSVFVGGCSPDTAQGVCDADLETLSTLVRNNLVQRADQDAQPRFDLLEIIREYGSELLQQSGDDNPVRRRHAGHFSSLVAEGAGSQGSTQARWLAHLDRELPNIRAAMDWCEETGDDTAALQIATDMYRYWYVRGRLREGAERIGRVFDRRAGDDELRARALANLSGLLWTLGDVEAAERRALGGVTAGTERGMPDVVMRCSTVLGLCALERKDFEHARLHIQRSGALAQELGRDLDAIIANTNLANIALESGNLDEAEERWQRSLAEHRERKDDGEVFALCGLGYVSLRRNRLDDAERYFSAALELAERLGFHIQRGASLVGLAAVSADRDNCKQAATYLGQAAAIAEQLAAAPHLFDEQLRAAAEEQARSHLGNERYLRIFEQARRHELATR